MADENWHRLAPAGVRTLPADLVATLLVTAGAVLAATLPVVRATPLRPVVGLVCVLFVPGYAVVAALFPEGGWRERGTADAGPTDDRGVDGVERVLLSVGLSVAITSLLALGLTGTPLGFTVQSVLLAVGAVTVPGVVVAARRRERLPPGDRFHVPYRRWYDGAVSELADPPTSTEAAVNVLLVVSLCLAAATVAFAVTVPVTGDPFTELYLLAEDEDGTPVAKDYPDELTPGERTPVVVGIGNHEREPVTYTVVVELQDVEGIGPNGTRDVVREEELARYATRVEHNESARRTVGLRPSMTGERLRIRALLYRGEVPAEPSVANAYRDAHLRVNVTESETGAGSPS